MKKATKESILDITFMLVYKNGYNGTSTAMILKECNIPKGSLYHHFKSKKDLVLAMIKERIAPKMDQFFAFELVESEDGITTIIKNIDKIGTNENLVLYGCPLNRLNQEMGVIDKDFEKEISKIYDHIKAKIVKLLKKSHIKDSENLADFIITSIWGSISLSPTQSNTSKYKNTIAHLKTYLLSLKN